MGKIKKKTGHKNSKQQVKRGKSNNLIATILLFCTVCAAIFASTKLESIDREPKVEKVEKTAKTEAIAKVEVKKESKPTTKSKKSSSKSTPESKSAVKIDSDILHLPAIADSSLYLYNKEGRYSLLYSPKDKVAKWVAYILTKTEVRTIGVERSSNFRVDTALLNRGVATAKNSDYLRSGYDRGHLLPSADRNDSRKENNATFLYGNIAPQRPNLNRKTINQLERATRNWAVKYDTLYIVTGSITKSTTPAKSIGNGVRVPTHFYKAILAKIEGSYQSVGFLLPNLNDVDSDFGRYITTIDNIEKEAGVDLFHHLPNNIENTVESSFKSTLWQ